MVNYTVNAGISIRDYRGLSTDTKPVDDDVPNGSTFYAMDTKAVYMFDGDGKRWIPQ